MKRWWWLALMIGCNHEAPQAVSAAHKNRASTASHANDRLLPCPTHTWKTLPPPGTARFGDACAGLDQSACTAKCDAGDALACTEAGVALGHEGKNYREQLRLYTHACELGNLLGCTNLGTTVRFDTPEWAPKKPNPACAADLFELTCAAGEPNGCGELAFAYIDGEGRPHDLAKALAAFEHGCVDAKLGDPVIAQSAAMECELFLETIDGGKLGAVDPAIVQAVEARMCALGNCWPHR